MLAAFSRKYGITFPLLSDESSRLIRETGMLNQQVQEHHAFYGIPVRDDVYGVPYPGAFLLDEQGIVREKRFQDSYRKRETGVAILEDGFRLESRAHGSEARAATEELLIRAYLDTPAYHAFQRLRLTVELSIAPGLHVYGRPIPDGYVPLDVEIAPIETLEVGELEGPEPQPFRVEGLDEQFVGYEDAARFSLPLIFMKKVGDQTLDATIRYQACSTAECFPPRTIQLRLPVRAESNVERDE